MDLDDLLPDSVFDGDLRAGFFKIFNHCDEQIRELEVLDLINNLAKLELFLEERGLLDDAIRSIYPRELLDTKINDHLIGSMAKIVGQHER